MKKKVIMTFEVEIPFDVLCDEESFKKDFGSSLTRICRYLYRQEGFFWDTEMKFKSARFKG